MKLISIFAFNVLLPVAASLTALAGDPPSTNLPPRVPAFSVD